MHNVNLYTQTKYIDRATAAGNKTNASGSATARFVGSNETGWTLVIDVVVGNYSETWTTNARITNKDMSAATGSVTFGMSWNTPGGVTTHISISGAKDLPTKHNYSLTYNPNAGSDTVTGMPSPNPDTYSGTETTHTFTVSTATPAREGYTFQGWSETSSGSAQYAAGNTITLTSSSPTKTLYAVWEKDAPTPPSKPTPGQVAGLLKEAVKIDCVNTEIDPEHADKTYDLISGTYSIGNVQGNATDGYTSVVTVLKKYAGQYVSKYDSEIGVDHSLDPADQTDQTITLEYKDGKWAVQAGSAPVTFTVKCATPPTEEPVDWTKLTISKKADKTTVKPGDTIIYTITVTNNTGKTLTNITVSDVLDSNLTFVSAEPVYYNSATGQWTIFSLTNGNSATLTITATVKSGVADGTQITNTAKITTVNAGGDALEEVNKSSSVEATVAIPAVEGIEKEVVTSAPNDVTIPEGTTVTYPTSNSVTVDNGTTSVTLLYKVTVTGDAGASYSVSDEGATCITNNATGTIPEGGEVVLYFTKTFTNLSTGDNTASNTASLVGTNYTDSVNVTITVKPAKPTDDELKTLLAGAVGVACTNESVEHASKTYNLLSGSYTIGDVTSVGDGTFTCTITVDAEKYVEAYNKDVAPGHDLDDESPKTIELVYRDKVWVKVSGVAELSDDEVIPPDITFGVLCTTYKLTYDANGGTGAPTDTKAYSHGAKVTLATTPVPTHAMYADGDPVVFIGWTASKTSTIYTKTDTAPATITSVTFDDSNITVYAAWGVDHNGDNIADVLQRVTLTYDANGGTGAPSSQSGLPGSFPISATRPTRTQYVFMGWATESSATTASYQPGGTITITANTTLYAVWEADLNGNGVPDKNETTYTVTYTDGVIGTKVFDDQVYSGLLSGTKTPAFVGTPTRTGYVFAGWVPAVAETVTENVTYVATWQKVSSSGLDNVPKTGDTSIAMIGGLMLFALCGGTAVYVIDRKKNRA